MINIPNFDSLAQKSFAPGATTDDYERLFSAAFALPEWHFIADGKFPIIAPYCGIFPGFLDDLPMVAAFTDTERLRQYTEARNISAGSANDPLILSSADAGVKFSSDNLIFSILPESFLGYVEKLLGYGVQGIFFNPNKDSAGFFISLKQLSPIREHLASKNMLSKREPKPFNAETSETGGEKSVEAVNSFDSVNFDALSVKATQTNAMEDLNALFGAAFALPEWQFIARGELPNINPYVASHPDYAGNQPMIRAFTDGKRLIRFARENNLTKADGSCNSLTIPTVNIIDYLEQFIPLGAYGIWFNSDTGSDGFFIPLKQLRPIKEHLAKLNQQKKAAPGKSVETLQLIVTEALIMPSLISLETPYKINYFWRVPSDWVENGQIKKEYFTRLDEIVLSNERRSETVPGGQYIIKDIQTKLFTPEMVETQNWRGIPKEDDDNIYYFCLASEDGKVKKVTAEEFQADVDASFQTPEKTAEPVQLKENAEKLNQTPASVQKPVIETLVVQIKDGLGFPSGFVKAAGETHHLFCRVPSDWIDGEQLKSENLEKIYAQFYGANWRMGNSDGSHYVVMDSYTKVFPFETVKTTKFGGTVNDDKNQFWFYIADRSGAIRKVTAEEFQKDIDASF